MQGMGARTGQIHQYGLAKHPRGNQCVRHYQYVKDRSLYALQEAQVYLWIQVRIVARRSAGGRRERLDEQSQDSCPSCKA
jgi:hypothetical protein